MFPPAVLVFWLLNNVQLHLNYNLIDQIKLIRIKKFRVIIVIIALKDNQHKINKLNKLFNYYFNIKNIYLSNDCNNLKF